MLCTFTTESGNLIVRSDDIRSIADNAEGECTVVWQVGNDIASQRVQGTALENRDRIQQEELDLIDRVNQHHLQAQAQAQMLHQQFSANPPRVARGKQNAQ